MTWETASYIVAVIAPCLAGVIFLYRHYISPIHAKVKVIWSEATGNGGKSIKDTVTRIDAVVADIRDQLATSANRQRILLQTFDTPVFEADQLGNFIWVNEAYIELVGRNVADILSNGWLTHVHQDSRIGVRAEWVAAIDQARDFDMDYTICNHKSGTDIHVRGRASTLRGLDQKILGYVGTVEVLRREAHERS